MFVFPTLSYYPQNASFQTPLKGQYKSSFSDLSLPKRRPSLEPPPYSPQDDLELRYQSQAKGLHYLRIANASAALVVSSTVVGFTAHSGHVYANSKSGLGWYAQRWLFNLDNRPTHVALGCGALIIIASLAYLLAAFIPARSQTRKLRIENITATVSSFLGLLVSLLSVIFTAVIASRENPKLLTPGTLPSWTCKWQGLKSPGVPDVSKQICSKTSAVDSLMIVLVIFEVLAVAGAGCGWWLEMRIKRGSGEEEIVAESV